MFLAHSVFKLQLPSHPDGAHFVFCKYGGPVLAPVKKSKQYDMGDLWAFGAFGRI